MLKNSSFALLFAAAAFAAVDVNQATEADLDGINGIGPGLSQRILAEREKGEFKDWADLIERVSVSATRRRPSSRQAADRARQTLQRGSLGQGTSQSQEQRRHGTTAGTIQKCFARKSGRRACKLATCCSPSSELRA